MFDMDWESRTRIFLQDVAHCLALAYQNRISLTPSGHWSGQSLDVLAAYTRFAATERPRNEREAPGLSWLRGLLVGGGLLAPLGGTLLLSDAAYDWLNQPPEVQIDALRQIWMWNHWSTWHWSGTYRDENALDKWWQSLLLRVLQNISALSPDSVVRTSDLLSDWEAKGFLEWNHPAQNLPQVRDAMAWRVPAVLTFLLEEVLPCLALAEIGGDARFRVTPEGAGWLAAALEQQDLYISPPPDKAIERDPGYHELHFSPANEPDLMLTPGLTVVLSAAAPAAVVFDVANIAELTSLGPPARCRVTPESFRQAAAWGYPPADVAFILERMSGAPLPRAALDRLQTWRRETVFIPYASGYCLHTVAPPILDALMESPTFRRRADPLASGQDAWVPEDQAADVFKWLRREGYTVVPAKEDQAEAARLLPTRQPLPLRALWVHLHTYRHYATQAHR